MFDLVVPQPGQPKQGVLMTLGVPAADAERGLRLMALLKQNSACRLVNMRIYLSNLYLS